MPLEHNLVRFLDNFSAGTRGAASAEHFLRTGEYAVIFMHRQYSLQPFTRHYSHSTNPFLEVLDIVNDDVNEPPEGELFPLLPPAPPHSSGVIVPPGPLLAPILHVLRSYKKVKSLNLLHTITFVSVTEYLFLLRGVAVIMGGGSSTSSDPPPLGRRGMYYLAAAVSDFFVPQQRMSEHKIQSGKGSLSIEMDQVPKILKPLVEQWSNEGFCISFKVLWFLTLA